MIVEREQTAATSEAALLTRLLGERIQGRHALFFTSDEGTLLPDGTEAMTGYVIDEQGAIHAFALGWDAQQGPPALTRGRCKDPEPFWDNVEESREARRAVGLAAPAPSNAVPRS